MPRVDRDIFLTDVQAPPLEIKPAMPTVTLQEIVNALKNVLEKRKIVTEEQGQRKQASNKSKASNEATEYAINPKQSYWPFALAASLMITLFGVVTLPVVFWIGLALIVVSVIGWGLERH